MNEVQRKRRRIDPKMIVGILAGLYTVSPIDAIPDLLPGIGQMDDGLVIMLAVLAVLAMMMMEGKADG